MESITEEKSIKYSKLTPEGKNKRKTAEFDVSYNDAETMNNNEYDRKPDHGSEIVFSNNRYRTLITFEFAPEKKISLPRRLFQR